MKPNTKKILLVVGVLFVGLIGYRIFSSKKSQHSDNRETPALVVATQTLAKGSVVEKTRISGAIRPHNEVEIFPKIAGRILSIHHEVGDTVKANDTLAVIEHVEVALQEKSAIAALAVAEANLISARRDFERAKVLAHEKVMSPMQLEGAELKFEHAEAQKKNAQAQADIAKQTRRNASITSPIAGIVAKKLPSVGTMVAPQAAVFTVQDVSTLKLVTSVDASTITKLKKGMSAEIVLDGVETQNLVGVLTVLSPSLDPLSRRSNVEIEIDDHQGLLPNMFVDGFLILNKSENVLLIPNTAIVGTGKDAHVYKVVDEKVVSVTPTFGVHDEKNTEVISGLNEGDRIVVTGVDGLHDGAQVTVE